jgi:parallel beta-helix repeat protein
MNKQGFALCGLLTLHIFSNSVFAQGPLVPPGPPGPTMKTLDQIEPRQPIGVLPFEITTPGAYYVTGNLKGVSAKDGITISADNVTIDLSGFSLTGGADTLAAIKVSASFQGITVTHGSIIGWQKGIAATTAARARFENLSISSCTGNGLESGAATTIIQCDVSGTGGDGVNVGASSAIRESTAARATGNGIVVGINSVVGRCNVISNTVGIVTSHFGVVESCQAFFNRGAGIAGLNGCRYTDCTAGGNSAGGITAGDQTQLNNCAAVNNAGNGVLTANMSQLEGVKSSGNSGSGIVLGIDCSAHACSVSNNGAVGINANQAAHLSDCKAGGNAGVGLNVAAGSTVQNCSALRNRSDGIRVSDECTVSGNTVTGNFNARDAAGIHTTGTDNCIKDNNVVSNDRGLTAESSGNTFIRNTVSNNTLNYSFADVQVNAPVMDSQKIETATNPFSNLTF